MIIWKTNGNKEGKKRRIKMLKGPKEMDIQKEDDLNKKQERTEEKRRKQRFYWRNRQRK